MDALVGGGFWHVACHRPRAAFDEVPACELNCLPKRHINSNEFLHMWKSCVTEWHAIQQKGERIIEILVLTDYTLDIIKRCVPQESNLILMDDLFHEVILFVLFWN